MASPHDPPSVRLSTQLYRALVRCYPPAFQRLHGRDLQLVFRDCCRAAHHDGGWPAVATLWPATLADLARTAGAEWRTVLGGTVMQKRMLDLVLATLLLVLTAPLQLLIALLIWRDSGGPVLFRQTRLGRGGRPFTLLKFRTMTGTTPAQMTRVGRWLRRSALDELPQLLNVLRGELSLVGPRPPLPADADLQSEVWQRLLAVTPGVAGPGQLSRRAGQSAEVERTQNLAYVAGRSLGEDLRILARTLAQLLGRG